MEGKEGRREKINKEVITGIQIKKEEVKLFLFARIPGDSSCLPHGCRVPRTQAILHCFLRSQRAGSEVEPPRHKLAPI